MDHERAFLQAIRDEPCDDAHRLIYADWLEEQGGAARTARAAFIRAQCRLAALPADDPSRDTLEDEADDVLAEYEREWTEPLHGLAEEWQFARGFIESVTLRGGDFLTHAEHLFDFAPLRAIHLLIKVEDIPRLAACPQLRWVETLDFRRCHLGDQGLQQLLISPHLARLTALNLAGNGISTPGMQALIHSPLFAQLTGLDLSLNPSTVVHQLFRAPQPTNLTDLNISSTRFIYYGQDASSLRSFAGSRLLRQLRSLDLSETMRPDPAALRFLFASPQVARLRKLYLRGIGAAISEPLATSPILTSLTTLDLRQNSLGAEGMAMLADSPNLASLTHLDVRSNNIRDTGAKAVAESPHLRRLTVLDLAGNGIGGPGLQALATSDNLDRLRTLNLAGNFIGGDSVRALAESAHLGRLAHLDLSDAYLEETSAGVLAESANLACLRTLQLQKNLLGDTGARALSQSPHLKRLTTLNLNDNRIAKAGAEALAAAPHWRHLRQLDLRGNVFTDTQETLLRSRFGSAVML
jgi:uncharacterized protein (TIGR02996 family)